MSFCKSTSATVAFVILLASFSRANAEPGYTRGAQSAQEDQVEKQRERNLGEAIPGFHLMFKDVIQFTLNNEQEGFPSLIQGPPSGPSVCGGCFQVKGQVSSKGGAKFNWEVLDHPKNLIKSANDCVTYGARIALANQVSRKFLRHRDFPFPRADGSIKPSKVLTMNFRREGDPGYLWEIKSTTKSGRDPKHGQCVKLTDPIFLRNTNSQKYLPSLTEINSSKDNSDSWAIGLEPSPRPVLYQDIVTLSLQNNLKLNAIGAGSASSKQLKLSDKDLGDSSKFQLLSSADALASNKPQECVRYGDVVHFATEDSAWQLVRTFDSVEGGTIPPRGGAGTLPPRGTRRRTNRLDGCGILCSEEPQGGTNNGGTPVQRGITVSPKPFKDFPEENYRWIIWSEAAGRFQDFAEELRRGDCVGTNDRIFISSQAKGDFLAEGSGSIQGTLTPVDKVQILSSIHQAIWVVKDVPKITFGPTVSPTISPTASPTSSPTISPTVSPTGSPTTNPTASPTSSDSPTTSPTASPMASPTPFPTFQIRNRQDNGLCMDVKNGLLTNGQKIILQKCDSRRSSQKWLAEDDGLLRSSANPDMCISVRSNAVNASVILSTCDRSDPKQWRPIKSSSGIRFMSEIPGRPMVFGVANGCNGVTSGRALKLQRGFFGGRCRSQQSWTLKEV